MSIPLSQYLAAVNASMQAPAPPEDQAAASPTALDASAAATPPRPFVSDPTIHAALPYVDRVAGFLDRKILQPAAMQVGPQFEGGNGPTLKLPAATTDTAPSSAGGESEPQAHSADTPPADSPMFVPGGTAGGVSSMPNAEPTATTEQAPDHPFPLAQIGGGGVIPAHEVDLRGPTLKNAQGNYNEAVSGAIDASTAGGGMQAGREYAMAIEAERAAQDRQRAAEQVAAEREEEMQQKQADFAQSAKALGQFAFKPDGGFWESRSLGQRVAGIFGLALNGFMAGVGRPVPDLVHQKVEEYVRAQENSYNALRDTARANETAFGMAIQKYGNADAARSMVRVAALEGLQAKAAQVMALNKGTEIGQRAAAAYADLDGQKMQQIQQGIRFLPSQATSRRFIDQNTGLVYSEQEAKALAAKHYEQGFEREKIGLNTASKVYEDAAKAGLERDQYGALGKAGAQKLAEEKAKAQLERDANVVAISHAQEDVDNIVGGSALGKAWAEHGPTHTPFVIAPSLTPFAADAKKHQLDREAYNRRVMMSVGAAYKLSTDANEPKQKAMVEHLAEPYTVEVGDNREVALAKMAALNKLISEGAEAKGATPPTLPSSLKFHDGWK